jgi:hypothetical protein
MLSVSLRNSFTTSIEPEWQLPRQSYLHLTAYLSKQLTAVHSWIVKTVDSRAQMDELHHESVAQFN